MTGLCQEFGALTISEIREYLTQFGVADISTTRLKNYIYCSELLGWLKRTRKGNHIYYVAIGGQSSLDFHFTSSVSQSEKEKVRWRTDIREYWRKNEPTRMKAIAEALSAGAKA